MRENPSVNRQLDDKEIDRIDHALGRPTFPLRETYRNHYATSAAEDVISFGISPYWERIGQQGDMSFFAVTEAGRCALDDYISALERPWRAFVVRFDGYEWIEPAQSRGRAKYSAWLKISDAWSELTFAEFIQGASVRIAA